MPKAPDTASDAEVSSFLKSSRSNAGPPPSSASGTATAAPSTPTSQDDKPDYLGQAGRGARKAVASLGVNLARTGNEVLSYSAPGLSRRLGELASQLPTAQRLTQFADEPYQSIAEGVGGVGADLASFALQPELGIERGALWLAGKYGPAAAKYTGTAAKAGQWVPTTFGKVSKAGAQIAEGAGRGAVSGAISDPDDPQAGAMAGAVGGAAIPTLAGPVGRTIMREGGARAPHAGLSALATFLNVPYHHLLNYAIGLRALTHEGSRAGRHAGEWVYDRFGRKIGLINPATGGVISSDTLQHWFSGRGEFPWPGSAAPTTAPNYGFDDTEEDSGQGSQAPATQ